MRSRLHHFSRRRIAEAYLLIGTDIADDTSFSDDELAIMSAAAGGISNINDEMTTADLLSFICEHFGCEKRRNCENLEICDFQVAIHDVQTNKFPNRELRLTVRSNRTTKEEQFDPALNPMFLSLFPLFCLL